MITYGGSDFYLRVLQCTADGATEYAVGPINDDYLRYGLVLQDGSSPALYCFCFDDLPAPIGWGRWVQGADSGWAEAYWYAQQDAVVMRVGERWGPLTLKVGGAAAGDGAWVSLVLDYQTPHGVVQAVFQPDYPYNDLHVAGGVPLRGSNELGSFITTGGVGLVLPSYPDGRTEDHIVLPRGIGSLGNQQEHLAQRLSRVRAYYRQEFIELRPCTAAVLDIVSCQLTVTGPVDARCIVEWEGTTRYPIPEEGGTYYDLGAGGSYTVTNLPPGKYVVSVGHPSDHTKGLRKQTVTLSQSGASETVAFGSSWTSTPPGKVLWGWIYRYDGEPCPGAEVWTYTAPGGGPPATWIKLGTADADGYFETIGPGPDIVVAYHPTYGCAAFDVSGGTPVSFWDPRLSVRAGAGTVYESMMVTENANWWGVAGSHTNLPISHKFGYLQNPATGEKYWLGPGSQGNGVRSEPFPMWRATGDPGSWGTNPAPAGAISYDLYDADGTDTGVNAGGQEDHNFPIWAAPMTPWYQAGHCGSRLSLSLGGKYEGPVLKYKPESLTKDVLLEPERVLLEYGEHPQPFAHMSESPSLRAQAEAAGETYVPALTFDTWECPYCGGPVAGPQAVLLGYTRGYCVQCADFGITTDCRAYMITPPLPSGADWRNTVIVQSSAGNYADVEIPGGFAPTEYQESDPYLIWDWKGLGIPRWVALHLQLGEVNNGTFTDGESITSAEARLGYALGSVQLKFIAASDIIADNLTLTVTAVNVRGGTEAIDVALPNQMAIGDIVLIKAAPQTSYPDGFFVDVTDVTVKRGELTGILDIVNAGPCCYSATGILVPSQAHQPFSTDFEFTARRPALWYEKVSGRTWQVVDTPRGITLHTRPDDQAYWAYHGLVFGPGYTYSSVCISQGLVYVCATSPAADRMDIAVSPGQVLSRIVPMANLGDGLIRGAIYPTMDRIAFCGYGNGAVWVGVASGAQLQRELLGNGAYLKMVRNTSGVAAWSSLIVEKDGAILVVIGFGDRTETWRAESWVKPFHLVAGPT
jgi:hypothetical protein